MLCTWDACDVGMCKADLYAALHVVGTAGSVLIREVSFIQCSL